MDTRVFEMEKHLWELQYNMAKSDYKSSKLFRWLLIFLICCLVPYQVLRIIEGSKWVAVIQTTCVVLNVGNLIFTIITMVKSHRFWKESEQKYKRLLAELSAGEQDVII